MKLGKNNNCPKNLVLLQVTSPLLSKYEISKTLNFISKKKIQSLFHVSKVIEHPNLNGQQLELLYFDNQ